MVPPPSDKVSRVSSYSGSRLLPPRFHVRGFHPLRPAFPKPFRYPEARLLRSIPREINPPVWALSFSLAATREIDFSFSSFRYLDVSVPGVPSAYTMYSCMGDSSSNCRVSPFGYQGIYACLRLPLAFRSLPRPSSALGALASTLCSSSLDLLLRLIAVFRSS